MTCIEVNLSFIFAELIDGLDYRIGALNMEKYPRGIWLLERYHNITRAAPAVGYDRRASRLRLGHGYPKIFTCGENEGARVPNFVNQG